MNFVWLLQGHVDSSLSSTRQQYQIPDHQMFLFLNNEWMPGITQTLLRHICSCLMRRKKKLTWEPEEKETRNEKDRQKKTCTKTLHFGVCSYYLLWLSVVYSQIPKDWTNPYFGDALKWQAFFEQMMIFVQCCGHFFSGNHLKVKRWRKFRADRELG